MKRQRKINRFRLLPAFIIIAILVLSLRINNIFDVIKNNQEIPLVFHATATAEETDKEIEELDEILEKSSNNTTNHEFSLQNEKIESETIILQELAERREFLDLRSREIDKKAIQLKISEEEIDKKISQLKEYEIRLKSMINEYNNKEKEKINSLIKLYSTMKPKDAAKIFDTLDADIVVAIMQNMKPSSSSAILSQMSIDKAKIVTNRMFGDNIKI